MNWIYIQNINDKRTILDSQDFPKNTLNKICIYKITNPKNKIYIGQTKNLRNRLYCYNNPNNNYVGRKLHSSIKKYGIHNHKIEIICELQEYNKLYLDELEKHYIALYNTVDKGLNLTYGGNGGIPSKETINKRINKITNKVIQYTIEGQFITEWDSLNEIYNTLGFSKELIRICINGNKFKAYNYRWSYKDKRTKQFEIKSRKINQYDSKGKFIKVWDSIKEAETWLGKSIRKCLVGKQLTSGGFKWDEVDI